MAAVGINSFAQTVKKKQSFGFQKFQCLKNGKPLNIKHFLWQDSVEPKSLLLTYRGDRIMIHKCYIREKTNRRECLSYYQGSAKKLCELETSVRKALRAGYIVGGATVNLVMPENLILRGSLALPSTAYIKDDEFTKNIKGVLNGEGCSNLHALAGLAETPSAESQDNIKKGIVASGTPSYVNLISLLEFASALNKDINGLQTDDNSEALKESLNLFFQLGTGDESAVNNNFYYLNKQGDVEIIARKKEKFCRLFTSDKPSWDEKKVVRSQRDFPAQQDGSVN